MACRELSLSPHPASPRPKKIVPVFENPQKPTLSKFSPNETGHFSDTPFVTSPCTAVPPHCISFQNFALCEIADRPQTPTARLACGLVCTTSGFAQKTDAKPVGGRGISAFFDSFFVHELFWSDDLFSFLFHPPNDRDIVACHWIAQSEKVTGLP